MSQSLSPGSKVGPYDVVAALGEGGMGEVYRARDPKLHREVALKIVPSAFALDADRLARFTREAQVLAALNHPNIAAIYGLEDSGDTRALVLELVDGPTLADRLARGAMPLDEVLAVARQIADALEAAHEKGIVHRDLKPANVKVRPDGTVKVLDFGLAKLLDREPASTGGSYMGMTQSPTITTPAMTMAGVILGTAAYMSPEQAKGRPADKRSDVWAFGCVLFEMLTGKRAFVGDDVSDTLAAVLRGEPDWSALPAAVPAPIRRLLRRCLHKDHRARLADVADARLEIDDALTNPNEQQGSADNAILLRLRRQRRGLLAALAAVMPLVAGIVWVLRSRAVAPAELMQLQLAPDSPVTLGPGASPMISPDGHAIAFFGIGADGSRRLYVRSLDRLETRPITTVGGTSWAVWSPDSQQLAFENESKLKKIDVSGGLPQTLCDLSVSTLLVGGSWNRDGVIIIGDASGGLIRASARGGPCQPLTRPDASEGNHLFPVFLPDGKHFLYLRTSGNDREYTSDLYAGSLDSPPEGQKLKKILRTDYSTEYVPVAGARAGRLLFVRDATLFAQPFDPDRIELAGEAVPIAGNIGTLYNDAYFSASNNGVLTYRTSESNDHQLVWVDGQGRRETLAGEPLFPRTVAVSRDGTQAAFESFAGARLMLTDLNRGTTRSLGVSSGLGLAWSPDGQRLAFASNDGIFQRRADGGKAEELLLRSPEVKYPLDWSSDGRFILYRVDNAKTSADIWALPVDGDRKPFPVIQTPANERDGRFSPDGKWIAYVSNESGRSEVFVRRFIPPAAATADTGGTLTISKGGVRSIVGWRADGKEIWYATLDLRVMGVELSLGDTTHTGDPRIVFQVPSDTIAGTTDGRRLLLAVPSERSTRVPYTVVLNWPALIRQ